MNLCLRGQTQMFLGLFEQETHSWLTRLSHGVATAIDIGVAYGEHTLFFLKKTKAATILAFDGDPGCPELIGENLKLNGLDQSNRLAIIPTFLGEAEPYVRLDSFLDRIQYPCIIKMDVDGAEVSILKSAKAINALPQVRWLIEVHSRKLEEGCQEILQAAGFETRVIPHKWWRSFLPMLNTTPQGNSVLNREDIRWLAAWKA
jgi:hypothetical protein